MNFYHHSNTYSDHYQCPTLQNSDIPCLRNGCLVYLLNTYGLGKVQKGIPAKEMQ